MPTTSASTTQGRILGLDLTLASRCGFSADLSGPVNDRAVFHVDNCYWLPNVAIHSYRCKTNTVSDTAFRGFGGPQGMFAIEHGDRRHRARACASIRSTCARRTCTAATSATSRRTA